MTAGHDGDEGRRQAYLAALGIPLWSARCELAGALPSAPLEYVPYAALATEALQVQQEPVPAPEVPPVMIPSAPVREAAEPPRIAEPQPVQASVAGRMPEKFPRFFCRVQPLAPGYSAVVTLGDAPDLSAAEHRLLANIADALGGDTAAMQPCEHLRWPLNRNPAFDHSVAAMLDWLAHALKLRTPRCLVFGEELAGHVRSALPQVDVIAAPTLAELLQAPAAKAGLWKALHG